MNAAIDTLTPAEAAVVAGVSMRDVHRVIDEHILPESPYDIREARSFRSDACVFIAFYFEAADRLTSEVLFYLGRFMKKAQKRSRPRLRPLFNR